MLYLHGFASSPKAKKAQFFREHFEKLGIHLETPALDQGDFEHLTIRAQRKLLQEIFQKQQHKVIIGSSLGGYLASLYASENPIDALILLAPAFNFGPRLKSTIGEENLSLWKQKGYSNMYHYSYQKEMALSYDFIEDLDHHNPWPRVHVPTLILHGTQDFTVPQETVEKWASEHPNAKLILLNAGHELTECLDTLWTESIQFLRSIPSVTQSYPSIL